MSCRINTILFDLDGTLLPMETDRFIDLYYDGMAIAGAPYGLDRQYLYDTVEEAFVAMLHTDGSMKNMDLFFAHLKVNCGENYELVCRVFEQFSDKEFDEILKCTGKNPQAPLWIKALKAKGYRIILATNPLFPARCTRRRIRWAGLDPADFDLITSYENHCYAKPSVQYFQEVVNQCGLTPERCLMVGNDVHEDMVAQQLGMQVYLLKNNLINSRNLDYSHYPQGYYEDFSHFVEKLPDLG